MKPREVVKIENYHFNNVEINSPEEIYELSLHQTA